MNYDVVREMGSTGLWPVKFGVPPNFVVRRAMWENG
jgi:hypothetical protein